MSGDPTAMEEAIRSHENNLDDHQTQATLSQVDELTNQIKEMSASRDSVLKEQNAAVDNLKQKQEMHQAQLAELRKMETQKDDIQEKMKKVLLRAGFTRVLMSRLAGGRVDGTSV